MEGDRECISRSLIFELTWLVIQVPGIWVNTSKFHGSSGSTDLRNAARVSMRAHMSLRVEEFSIAITCSPNRE